MEYLIMPRLPRFVLPGHPQHVIQRGNDRQNIFRSKEDFEFYLGKIFDAAEIHQCDIHAYILMTNHVHLLVTPNLGNSIGKMMQSIGRYYVQFFNKKYKRTGTLWEGRYKATLIDSEQYLLTCMRYIELNPVRAQMVDHPSKYAWSSFGYNALGQTNNMVTPHREYKQLGRMDSDRQANYRKLFKSQIPKDTLEALRKSTNKAQVLGGSQFKQRMEHELDRPVESMGHGGDRKSDIFKKLNQRV